ncbi:MAG: contractile injection system protein, VgrG/Pvc8 family, partial [Myxococcota bacterium]
EDKADRVLLQLDNFDLSLFDRDDLMGGSLLEVVWGYPGRASAPQRVVVKKIKGFQRLTVEGHALSMLMNQAVKTRNWSNTSRSAVARSIAEENGYAGSAIDIEDTEETLDIIHQSAETDAGFLRRLAAQEGFEFYVDSSGFHFHRRKKGGPPAHSFTWYADPSQGNLMSVHVESDLARRAGRVTVRGRDPLQKKTIETTAVSETVDRTTLGEVIEVVDPETGETALETRNATASVHPTTSTTERRAQRESDARFRQAEQSAVKLTLRVVGDPTLRAKNIIEVRGISRRLSGKYYASTVRHIISTSGYVTELKLTRDGASRRTPAQRPQGGTRNTAEPRSVGQLIQVEVVDPETGNTSIEYRHSDQGLGTADPEARP